MTKTYTEDKLNSMLEEGEPGEKDYHLAKAILTARENTPDYRIRAKAARRNIWRER